MRNLAVYLCFVCVIILSAGCGKGSSVTPATQLTGTYTADVVEASSNNTTWTNITLQGTREILTLRPDNTYTSGTLMLSTGVISDTFNGTWSQSADGSSITFAWGASTQTFTIQSLTATNMVALFNWGNINTPYKSSMYQYNRITYTRK